MTRFLGNRAVPRGQIGQSLEVKGKLMTEWRPIATTPSHPMPVIFNLGNMVWHDSEGRPHYSPNKSEPYRNDKIEVGFWDGTHWRKNGTGHNMFEGWRYPDYTPTHWLPIPTPPLLPALEQREGGE